MSLDVRRISPSDIGITLEDFKQSPHFLGKDKFKPPKDLLALLRKDINSFENEYFEKVASACIYAADALTNNMISRLYWFAGGGSGFINLITRPRYHLIKEAIYMEISWRCVSGKIPETYNRTILATNGVNIIGNERDFLITEQFLSPVALRTLLNAGLEDFISTLDTDRITDQVVLLSDWKEAKNSLTSSIQSNARSIGSVSNVANEAKSKADDAARSAENNKGNISNNSNQITRIDNLANSINSDLQETKNQVNTNKRNITTKQNKLPDSNGAKLIKVSNDTVTYESVNIAQDTNFIQVKNKLAEMENKAEEIKTSLDQNVQTTQEIKSDIDNLNTELTEAQKRTETVAKNLGKSNLRIQALERSGGGAGGGIQLPNSDGPKLINVNDNVVTYEKINIAQDEDFIKIKDRIDGVENKSSQNEQSVHYLGGLIGDLNTNKQDRLRDSNGAKLIKVNDYGTVSYVEPEFQGISEKVDLIDWKVDRCEDSLYSKQNKLPNSNGAKLIKVENGAITYEDPASSGEASHASKRTIEEIQLLMQFHENRIRKLEGEEYKKVLRATRNVIYLMKSQLLAKADELPLLEIEKNDFIESINEVVESSFFNIIENEKERG
ncbi:hypothetical protein [Mycoplasmopsis pullorum]|uniref:hypothetical protein n=1 Tax=Mycoplasmopsis pullorum TaxID=48003 RepID=UPI00111912EE|nr:hypothetical protein [Mycoplasmopsis pullorum]TNK83762.1 hypothetical protein C4M93_01285 [Mycoplasmopsis pullorum]TNK88201.1 hypothetical protein C4M89_03235 [Mycoplasmopsis pullorum]TNK92565.1 hypothetical protein C4M96_00345 [Mycoplasmopsis pullorum]